MSDEIQVGTAKTNVEGVAIGDVTPRILCESYTSLIGDIPGGSMLREPEDERDGSICSAVFVLGGNRFRVTFEKVRRLRG